MSFDHTINKGTTSKIVEVMLRDSSTGQGVTGLASGSVTASYVREGGTRVAITLAVGSAGDAYSSGKWAEVDATNQRGLYQLHIPDAALATGVDAVTIGLQASGALDKEIRISLIDVDLRNAANMGLGNLDAALSSRSSHSASDVVSGGAITTSGGAVSNVTTVATTTTNTDMRGTDSAFLAASAPSNFSSLGINVSGHLSRVTLVDTTTANTDMRGTDNAFLAASAPTNFSIMVLNGSGEVTTSNPASGGGSAHTAADVADLILETPANKLVTNVSGEVVSSNMRGTDGANTTTPPTAASIRAEIDSNSTQLAAIVADTNELQTDWANGGRLDAILDARASQSSIDTVDSLVDTLIAELTTAVSEPTGAPGATAKVGDMLAYMYGALRNKVDVTSSAKTFHSNAGTALWSKALSCDSTTYSEAKGS